MNEEVKPYICYKALFCDERFDTEEEREEHMRLAHPEQKRRCVPRKERKWHYSRIPDDAESTETDEDRNKEGPYLLPLEMIAMRCDSKGKSLRPKIRDEVWKFCSEPIWGDVVKHYMDLHKIQPKKFMVTKIALKMAKKIFEQTELKVFPITDRTYAGHIQMTHGAWSWVMITEKKGAMGSHYPMKFLLRKDVNLDLYYFHTDYTINPDIEGEALYKKLYLEPWGAMRDG